MPACQPRSAPYTKPASCVKRASSSSHYRLWDGHRQARRAFRRASGLPKTIESYYQETGRAGRDGTPADAWMIYGLQDVIKLRQMMEGSDGSEEFKRWNNIGSMPCWVYVKSPRAAGTHCWLISMRNHRHDATIATPACIRSRPGMQQTPAGVHSARFFAPVNALALTM